MSRPTRNFLALVTPTWLTLGLLFVAPLLVILAVSFARPGPYGTLAPIDDVAAYVCSGAFLANYARTLDPRNLLIFWRSLWIAVVTTALCLIVSYPIAYYIARVAAPRRKNLLLVLVVVPFWTSFVIRTYAWMILLGQEGVFNTALLRLRVIAEPLDLLYTPFAVTVGLVYGELPFMILPLYASLEKLDGSLLEAASDLGAGRWSTFWRVTVPATAPGILAGVVLVFIPSLGQYVVSDLLGGARGLLAGKLINDYFKGRTPNAPLGSALAFELTAVVLLMLWAYAWYAKRRGAEVVSGE
jgi:spermidine/putrescine transport system permease protein